MVTQQSVDDEKQKSLVGGALVARSQGCVAVTDSEGFGRVGSETFQQILGGHLKKTAC